MCGTGRNGATKVTGEHWQCSLISQLDLASGFGETTWAHWVKALKEAGALPDAAVGQREGGRGGGEGQEKGRRAGGEGRPCRRRVVSRGSRGGVGNMYLEKMGKASGKLWETCSEEGD